MVDTKFPLSFSSWGKEETNALQEVIESGQFTMGPRVAKFEKEFAAFFGRKFAVMVNSGSSANLILIAALTFKKNHPLQAGDEVLVPAVAWATSYAPLKQYGLNIKVVDVDRNTLNIDIEQLRSAITSKTKLIVGISILGNPAPLDEIEKIAKEHNILFIEDNCESLGASLHGKFTGNFGLAATASFFYAHHISTMEGGMILTDDEELNDLCRALRAHGWTRDISQENSLVKKSNDQFAEAYRFLLPGYNVRPLEFSGATGSAQLKKLDGMIKARRENADCFRQLMAPDNRYILQRENGQSSWYSFTILVHPEAGVSRKQVLENLRAAGIEFRLITGGNIMRHEYATLLQATSFGKLPNANFIHDYGFFIGNAPFPIFDKLKYVSEALKNI